MQPQPSPPVPSIEEVPSSPLVKIGTILLAMSGIIVHKRSWWLFLPSLFSIITYWLWLAPQPNSNLAILFFVVATLLHYGLLGIFFTRLGRFTAARRLIASKGEEPAFAIFVGLMAFAFCLNGLSTGYICTIGGGLTWLFPWVRWVLGVSLFGLGLVTKVWATYVVGLNTYYYKDLFVQRPVSSFKAAGPYRFLANPMYGVGHLHAYGLAILSGSLLGLLAVAVNQGCVWAFYYLIERPFIQRTYLNKASTDQ